MFSPYESLHFVLAFTINHNLKFSQFLIKMLTAKIESYNYNMQFGLNRQKMTIRISTKQLHMFSLGTVSVVKTLAKSVL